MTALVIDETLRDPHGRAAAPSLPLVPQLFVTLECARPHAGSARHALVNIDEVVIGRGPERTAERVNELGVRRLVLQLPDARVSARHARLRHRQGWELEDLGSTNGCRVDGQTVLGPTVLQDGAQIEIGHTLLIFRAGLPMGWDAAGDQDASELPDGPAVLGTLLPGLATAFDTLVRVAKSSVPILLLGETGSGKELLARAIHATSGRSGEFVAINCGAIPDTLMEAQLFGHVKGAFSGANRDELGYVRAAHRGTLFLDEIAELPSSTQSALLRVLQENEIVPVGTTRPIPVDIRVIAATHAPIDELVRSGSFRNDLFARLAGFRFVAPPLRERREELGLLIANVLREVAPSDGGAWTIDPAVARALTSYDWPRNVRELKQLLAAAVVLADAHTVEPTHVPAALLEPREREDLGARAAEPPSERDLKDAQLREEVIAQFRECRGNVSEVARRMGKARVQIQRWMARFAIDPASFRERDRRAEANVR